MERGCRPLIRVDMWHPIYNCGYGALWEKRVNEEERTPEGWRSRVHHNHPFVDDSCHQFFHSGR
jgi:hypothetical protein